MTAAEGRLTAVEGVNTVQDGRLTAIEGVNTVQDGRLTAIEAVDVAQTARLDANDILNTTQNTRLTAVEGVNATQNTAIASLQSLTATHTGQISTLFSLAADNSRQAQLANEGVALALSMESPSLAPGSTFGFSGGVGYYNHRSAGSLAFTARVGPNATISAGVGMGFNTGEVGARGGFQISM